MGKSQRGDISNGRQARDMTGVSPDSYSLNMSNKKKDPSYSFGGKYPTKITSIDTPGAGSYSIPTKIIESTGKTMGAKSESKTKLLGPGPGGYNVDKAKRNDLKYSFGAKGKDIAAEQQQYKPGPGNYNILSMQGGPTTKFGSGSRADMINAKEN